MSDLSDIMQKHFPKMRFLKGDLLRAGKVLKTSGEDAVVEYLTDKQLSKDSPNFQPPVKCVIVAQSRPFEQWPIYAASEIIQRFIYSQTKADFDAIVPGTSLASHSNWFQQTGIEVEYRSVMGLNLIFKHARARYEGVPKKVENRNKKGRERCERDPDYVFEEEVAFDATGRLLHPPGKNASLYCYQSVRPRPFVGSEELPAEYHGYCRDVKEILPSRVVDRLAIPKGEPGYVPEHQRHPGGRAGMIKEGGSTRRRQWYAKSNHKPKAPSATGKGRTSTYDPIRLAKANAAGAILAIIRIQQDWLLVDLRGLLRDVRRRGVGPQEGVSIETLLAQFTGDPVIDTRRGIVTFTYKPGVVPVHVRKTIHQGKAPECIAQLIGERGPVGLVSMDFGQTHPVAYSISRVTNEGGLIAKHVTSDFLPEELISEVSSYRRAHDVLERSIERAAAATLTPEQQEEIRCVSADGPRDVRSRICTSLSIPEESIAWDAMRRGTTFLADAVLARGGDSAVAHMGFDTAKAKKRPPLKRYDSKFATKYRRRLTDETRKALNEAIFKLKRGNLEYDKLSHRKRDLARRAINYIVRDAQNRTLCSSVVLNIEDLNVRFFHGKGKQVPGWDGFFVPRSENRWFMQALHKASCEQAAHKGLLVVESLPHRTSQTCPECGHCDKGNRNGVVFECLHCHVRLHADRDVATRNLERIALTGKPMPKPAASIERLCAASDTGTARTRKPSRSKDNSTLTNSEDAASEGDKDSARESACNAAE